MRAPDAVSCGRSCGEVRTHGGRVFIVAFDRKDRPSLAAGQNLDLSSPELNAALGYVLTPLLYPFLATSFFNSNTAIVSARMPVSAGDWPHLRLAASRSGSARPRPKAPRNTHQVVETEQNSTNPPFFHEKRCFGRSEGTSAPKRHRRIVQESRSRRWLSSWTSEKGEVKAKVGSACASVLAMFDGLKCGAVIKRAIRHSHKQRLERIAASKRRGLRGRTCVLG